MFLENQLRLIHAPGPTPRDTWPSAFIFVQTGPGVMMLESRRGQRRANSSSRFRVAEPFAPLPSKFVVLSHIGAIGPLDMAWIRFAVGGPC